MPREIISAAPENDVHVWLIVEKVFLNDELRDLVVYSYSVWEIYMINLHNSQKKLKISQSCKNAIFIITKKGRQFLKPELSPNSIRPQHIFTFSYRKNTTIPIYRISQLQFYLYNRGLQTFHLLNKLKYVKTVC